MLPPAWSSTTFSRPIVQSPASPQWLTGNRFGSAQARGSSAPGGWREALAAPVAEICLRRLEVVPIGRRLDAAPFDGDEFALYAEQSLDDALGLLVASLVGTPPMRPEPI